MGLSTPFSAADVGQRVTVRRNDGTGPRHLVGLLEGYDEDGLHIRRRDGVLVDVPHWQVVVGRRVAERSPTVRELESIAARGWRALEEAHLGDWLLRAGEGWTGRANSVLPIGEPDRPLPAAVDAVEDWYGARNLPPLFQLPDGVGPGLAEELSARGYLTGDEVAVLTAPVPDALAADTAAPTELPPVEVLPAPDDAWLAAYHYRGGVLPPVAPRILVNADRPAFLRISLDGAVVAIARAAVDLGWVGITAVEVDPAHRRRGLGRHLIHALLEWSAGQGAHHAYLQVAADNLPAVSLYESLGFAVHHHYRYLHRD